jgi:UDP-2-acetamido-3-amino-2,3-dideoxy-glucuronate N-acetyltransferase
MSALYVHPSALVETTQIGEGTRIWAFTHVMAGVTIGAACNIGSHCFLEAGATIADNVTIKNGNMIWEGVTLEEGVFVGPGAIFTNDQRPRSPRLPQAQERYKNKGWLVPTLVRRGASIGAGAIILPGVTIGEFAFIGAGAVVTRNAPPYGLVMGNPGARRGWVCECGSRLVFEGREGDCPECGRAYRHEHSMVRPLT